MKKPQNQDPYTIDVDAVTLTFILSALILLPLLLTGFISQ